MFNRICVSGANIDKKNYYNLSSHCVIKNNIKCSQNKIIFSLNNLNINIDN